VYLSFNQNDKRKARLGPLFERNTSPPDIFHIFPEFWYVGERESGVEEDADAAFEE
jgi:hypothetical protein